MGLTAKQHQFAMEVASGKTLCDSYRAAYSAENMKNAVIRNEASKLMARRDVTMTVQRLRSQQEAAFQAATLSDRDRVLSKLRQLLEDPESMPPQAAQVALKAAHLLGQTVGMYVDRQEITKPPQRSAAELREELERRLKALLGEEKVH